MVPSIPISVFSSLQDATPTALDLAWPGDLSDPLVVEKKEGTPLWSPVRYHPGKGREKGKNRWNVESVYALVLDYDKDQGTWMDVAKETWREFELVLHTTHSHAVDPPRFRVVLPLTRPVSVPEYDVLWEWAQRHASACNAAFDPACKDAGRMYYLPSAPSKAAFQFEHVRGEVLYVEGILAAMAEIGIRPEPLPPFPGTASPGTPSSLALSRATRLSNSVFGNIEYPFESKRLDLIEAKCAFARHAHENAAVLSEPEWYAWLSIVGRCVDGHLLAHEIGKAHPQYDEIETAEKLDRAITSAGPRTCADIRGRSRACAGCSLGAPVGPTQSPVELGRPDPDVATPEEIREDVQRHRVERLMVAQSALEDAEAALLRANMREAKAKIALSYHGKFAMSAEGAFPAAEEREQARAERQVCKEQWDIAKKTYEKIEREERIAQSANPQANPAALAALSVDAKTGVPRGTLGNALRIFELDPVFKNKFRFNTFASKLYYDNQDASDEQDCGLTAQLEHIYNVVVPINTARNVAAYVARANSYHPVRDYLRSLVWDETPRIETMLNDGFGVAPRIIEHPEHRTDRSKDVDIVRWISVKFMIGCVARIFEPGCDLDEMLVLMSPEHGAGKSKGLRELVTPWFSDSYLSIGDKDAVQQLRGNWLYEVAELDSFRKVENSRIKMWLSSREDNVRMPYAHHAVRVPRETVIVGTTNEERFLDDPTGSRRYMPVRVTVVDRDWIRQNRDQLWAEARVLYEAKVDHKWTREETKYLTHANGDFQEEVPWETKVVEYLHDLGDRPFTTAQIFESLKIPVERQNRALSRVLCPMLRRLGYRDRSRRIQFVVLDMPGTKELNRYAENVWCWKKVDSNGVDTSSENVITQRRFSSPAVIAMPTKATGTGKP